MVFQCQKDSFLKEFTSKVVSIQKNDGIDEYSVILEDTILFPEGGGQPCDYGFLNDKPVINVIRKGSEAIHIVKSQEPFEIGESVTQKIDWERRHDHMQQHSGQHLITAIFEREYNMDTKSWWLGTESSYIELDAKDISEQQLDNIEKIVNRLIADYVPVTVQTIGEGDTSAPPEVTRATRGLPKDHVGAIRVVTIEGVESNMCCGTHVKNLAQLQIIKLLHVEKSKNKLLVYFLVGNRVLKKLRDSYKQELDLNLILKGGFATHIDLIKKIQLNLKSYQKTCQHLIKEIAINESKKYQDLNPKPRYYFLHRLDGIEMDFITTFLKNVQSLNETFFFLTVGDDFGKGQMVLQGQSEIIKDLGTTICNLLEGKGNGKNNKYQAKINNLKKIQECENVIAQYFDK